MTRYLIFALVVLTSLVAISGEKDTDPTKRDDIKVLVYGLKSNDGKVVISLFNSKDSFDAKDETKAAVRHQSCKIGESQAWCIFKKMTFGKYAIRLYHDENDNNRIDTNFLGIPKEGYGFSNNAKGIFSPPGFKKSEFHFSSNYQTQRIKMKY